MAAAGSMGVIALYQMGIIRHLPDLPLPYMDADRVDASEEAYSHLQMGDAFIGLTSYGVTAMLAAAGGAERTTSRPWLPMALAAKATADAVQAARLTYDQWANHRAFCIWCLIAASATFVILPLTYAESAEAVDAWGERPE